VATRGDEDTLTADAGRTGHPAPAQISVNLETRYESLAFLGQGGMGAVYLARDRALGGKEVALKLVPPELAGKAGLETLRREVLLAQQVTHRNVCRIYDLEEVEGRWMIKMEYIAGETLAERVAPGRLSIVESVAIGRQIADGLGAAHQQGVVHRDLKPSNVMIERTTGRVVLMDFGLARPSAITGETAPEIVGTPGYMAPEQVLGQHVDARTDIYALGCVLYHLVVGEMVFPATTPMAAGVRHVRDAPPDPHTRRPEVPHWLATAILAMLAKDPDQRPPDIAAVHRLLAPARRGRRRLAITAATAGVAGIAAVAAAMVFGAREAPARREWTPKLALLPVYDENSFWPVYSPDGTRIAYESDRERTGSYRVYVARADGSDDHAITPPSLQAVVVSWSHDGKAVVFTDLAGRNLYRMPVAGGPPELLAAAATGIACGASILLSYYSSAPACPWCGQRLVLRTPDGTKREVARFESPQNVVDMRCDRRGDWLAYTLSPQPQGPYPPADLYLLELASGARRQLTHDGLRNLTPTFTPDGRSIVFASARGGHINLWEISIDGGEPVQLTSGVGNDVSPDIAPDGRTLVFDADITSRPLFAHPATGTPRRLVPSRPVLQRLEMTPDGSEVIATDYAPLAPRIVAIRLSDGAMRTLAEGSHGAPTPDGREVVYATGTEVRAVARGGGASRTLAQLGGDVFRLAVDSDGAVHTALERGGTLEAWRLPLTGGIGKREAPSPWCFVLPAPAGGWSVWYRCDGERRPRGVLVAPGSIPDPAATSGRVMDHGAFDATGRAFVFDDHGTVSRLEVATGITTRLFEVRSLWALTVSPDGETVYTSESVGRVQRTLITNFADRPRPAR